MSDKIKQMARPTKKLESFATFLRLYYDLRDANETYTQTYERTEVLYSDLYGQRLFNSFASFHTYKTRYEKSVKLRLK